MLEPEHGESVRIGGSASVYTDLCLPRRSLGEGGSSLARRSFNVGG
jgi:hypothetical protein